MWWCKVNFSEVTIFSSLCLTNTLILRQFQKFRKSKCRKMVIWSLNIRRFCQHHTRLHVLTCMTSVGDTVTENCIVWHFQISCKIFMHDIPKDKNVDYISSLTYHGVHEAFHTKYLNRYFRQFPLCFANE